jgi:hypothetical protein
MCVDSLLINQSINQFIDTKNKTITNLKFIHAQEAQLVKGQQSK